MPFSTALNMNEELDTAQPQGHTDTILPPSVKPPEALSKNPDGQGVSGFQILRLGLRPEMPFSTAQCLNEDFSTCRESISMQQSTVSLTFVLAELVNTT